MMNVTEIYPIETTRCRALWLYVIYQALLDLVSEDESYEGLVIQGEARRWFFTVNGSFTRVCGWAGRDPMAVRKRAREIETNPSLLGQFHV